MADNHHDDAQHQRDAPQTAAGRRAPGPTRLLVTNGAAAFLAFFTDGAAAAAAQLGVLAHVVFAAGVLEGDKLIHWVFVSVLLCLAKLHAGALLALEMALARYGSRLVRRV